jgi:Zn-dependent peptidase ImmA (M78 family)
MIRVPVQPRLITWARERAGVDPLDLEVRFPKLAEWEDGARQPTLRQLEHFARAVHAPLGYFFLPEPPDEPLPIPDFRTVDGRRVRRPSPELLDTLYVCQERQAWYREHAQITRQPEVAFVGSATPATPPEEAARRMRETLGFDLDQRRDCATWTDALRLFVRQAEGAGVLVMVNGVVLSNTHRPLDPAEFRGFALADRLAPLVFIKGADTKAAQMFTLAHELAHLWLGTSAVSDLGAAPPAGHRREEVWCNAVAAELLAPLEVVRAESAAREPLDDTLRRLARRFKVSTLVILRRLLDAGRLDRPAFDAAWRAEIARLQAITERGAGGGDFYRTTLARVGHRFARAVVESTLEGQTLYRDAFRMLGVARSETFDRLGREAWIVP